MSPTIQIPAIDLHAQYLALKDDLDAAVARVLDSGWYILGQEVAAFEQEFAAYHGLESSACVGLNSGTDALYLALLACGIGPDDEVITVSHTAVATVAAVRLTGATPVLVDIEQETYTLDPTGLEQAITPRTRAIVPVHIYGQSADLAAVNQAIAGRDIYVIEDCAQAHGARYQEKSVGTIGDLGCFSFYPTKNLGALGDGGAVIGRNAELLEQIRLLREYGWTPQSRYVSQIEGTNSRLDEMQAALLRVKLQHLDAWNDARRHCAALYAKRLPEQIAKPVERPGNRHVYHLYVVRVSQREQLRAQLQIAGVGTGIHYPVPVHQQPAYQGDHVVVHTMSSTEQAAEQILSLPMHPFLTEADVAYVANSIQNVSDKH